MKYLLSLAALAATFTGLAQAPSEAILGFGTSGVIGYGGTLGWTFESTNAFAVTQLGCFAKVFEDNPLVTSVQVGLWNDSGLLLASNSITLASILFEDGHAGIRQAIRRQGEGWVPVPGNHRAEDLGQHHGDAGGRRL